jgi:hypothetical protein
MRYFIFIGSRLITFSKFVIEFCMLINLLWKTLFHGHKKGTQAHGLSEPAAMENRASRTSGFREQLKNAFLK